MARKIGSLHINTDRPDALREGVIYLDYDATYLIMIRIDAMVVGSQGRVSYIMLSDASIERSGSFGPAELSNAVQVIDKLKTIIATHFADDVECNLVGIPDEST